MTFHCITISKAKLMHHLCHIRYLFISFLTIKIKSSLPVLGETPIDCDEHEQVTAV